MELIYTDENLVDIGYLSPISFDLAYGVDENDFELVIKKKDHCCVAGSVIYVEGEEYGGIVDNISLTSSEKTLKYSGRTFHGVLNSKIIQPPKNEDYLILYGDANEVLAELIELLDLSELFSADTKLSGIDIVAYEMERYIPGYDGIRNLLNSVGAKLKMQWKGRHVVLSAEPLIDYSVSDEFLMSAVSDLDITKVYNPVNHIIALGAGDLAQRKVIHIFTDKDGIVQPYSALDVPVKDSDYIADTRNQQLFGKDEVCEIYDLPNAEAVENYVLLKSRPQNWNSNFKDYFELNDEDSFEQIKEETADEYTLLQAKPSDWNNNFQSYYVNSDGSYTAVDSEENESYIKLKSKPKDWKTNYSEYYYYFSDGVSVEYKSAEGVTKYKYQKQKTRPTDWNANYSSYYKKDNKGKFVKLNKFENWKANKYYTRYSYSVAPKWETKYYRKKTTSIAPSWRANTYYSKSSKVMVPPWRSNTYYQKFFDNYSSLVEGCLQRLNEAWNADTLDITLNPEKHYDIGDIVGAVDDITGVFVSRQIREKIVTRNLNGKFDVSYEEGVNI